MSMYSIALEYTKVLDAMIAGNTGWLALTVESSLEVPAAVGQRWCETAAVINLAKNLLVGLLHR